MQFQFQNRSHAGQRLRPHNKGNYCAVNILQQSGDLPNFTPVGRFAKFYRIISFFALRNGVVICSFFQSTTQLTRMSRNVLPKTCPKNAAQNTSIHLIINLFFYFILNFNIYLHFLFCLQLYFLIYFIVFLEGTVTNL